MRRPLQVAVLREVLAKRETRIDYTYVVFWVLWISIDQLDQRLLAGRYVRRRVLECDALLRGQRRRKIPMVTFKRESEHSALGFLSGHWAITDLAVVDSNDSTVQYPEAVTLVLRGYQPS